MRQNKGEKMKEEPKQIKMYPLEKILSTSLGDYMNFTEKPLNLPFSAKYDLVGISVQRFNSSTAYGTNFLSIKEEFATQVPMNAEMVLDYTVNLSLNDRGMRYVANGVALVKKGE